MLPSSFFFLWMKPHYTSFFKSKLGTGRMALVALFQDKISPNELQRELNLARGRRG
jgi:hypothetical protein